MDLGVGLGLGYSGLITSDSKSNDLEDYNGGSASQFSVYGIYSTDYTGLADKIKSYKEEASFHFEYRTLSFLFRYYPTSFFYLEIGPQFKSYEEPPSHIYYAHESGDPLIREEVAIKNNYSDVVSLAHGVGLRIKRIEISLTSMIDITPSAKANSFKSDYSNASVRFYNFNLNFSFYFLRLT